MRATKDDGKHRPEFIGAIAALEGEGGKMIAKKYITSSHFELATYDWIWYFIHAQTWANTSLIRAYPHKNQLVTTQRERAIAAEKHLFALSFPRIIDRSRSTLALSASRVRVQVKKKTPHPPREDVAINFCASA